MSRKSTLRKRTQRFADDNLANARTVAKTGRKAAKSGWNEITDVLEGVADRTSSLAGETKSRIKDIERESARRGRNAKDALAGRQPKRRGRVAGAAAIGVGVGAVVAMLTRKINAQRERMRAQRAATAVAEELRRVDQRTDSVMRDGDPLTDAELDSIGLGSRSNGAAVTKPVTPRVTTPEPAPAANGLGTATGPTPESRKPTS